jgi:hypothetical protein
MVTLTLPREQFLPGWRRAVLAYRAARQGGRDYQAADAEAIAAFRKVLPDMPEEEAVRRTTLDGWGRASVGESSNDPRLWRRSHEAACAAP